MRSNARSVGFVADERRINVGLTRARCSLIVLANCKALARDHVWGKLLKHARDIGCMYETRHPFASFLKSVINGDIKPEAPDDVPEVCGWGAGEALGSTMHDLQRLLCAQDMELDADCYSD